MNLKNLSDNAAWVVTQLLARGCDAKKIAGLMMQSDVNAQFGLNEEDVIKIQSRCWEDEITVFAHHLIEITDWLAEVEKDVYSLDFKLSYRSIFLASLALKTKISFLPEELKNGIVITVGVERKSKPKSLSTSTFSTVATLLYTEDGINVIDIRRKFNWNENVFLVPPENIIAISNVLFNNFIKGINHENISIKS